MNIFKIIFSLILMLSLSTIAYCQQDPQYTQYSHNPMTVNAGYTGSRGHTAALALYRSQWVGIEGSPRTINFSIDSPLDEYNGIGLSIIQDDLGPSQETYIDGNYAHHLIVNRKGDKLAFGLKGGLRFLNIDWSKGIYKDPDVAFSENINSKILPTIGAGVFYYTDNYFLGLSVPNILKGNHYNEIQESEATERKHLYLIGGYVFKINPNLKFKPSFFTKYVSGSPLSVDASINFLIHETLNLGVSYRWDDSVNALLGLQVSPRINIGYAYDYATTNLKNYNNGSHEIFFRYQFTSKETKIKSPRFF
ncbi:MAG: type IX secretion system membrane protein PorP/SprF [Cellulophaga sp.]|uniref:PorP/SprF family type IX secretion system membrane protein n=1 Tax=unclassified Cellulophaga TaxID=2634405 RepID=UPI0026E27B3B|nr:MULTISPECIES: type IX secretion system membrane protein PorP/SprF [unclassified Cellulophaga]MDO6491401.1 type IX secretion system membrane protein PorP/SprF [Cellulophaga sp. 2_MG-2023]MDO6495066.1 type IX secretion system membrane protein PorP/SprF [Cellulophaga sp. 3_MG-2023]